MSRNAPQWALPLVLLSCALALSQSRTPEPTIPAAAPKLRCVDIPLSFEPNEGQAPAEVRYVARGTSYTLYLARGEMVLAGHNQAPLRMKLSGADPGAGVVGERKQDSTSSYFTGNDPSKWRTSVPNYERARYRSLYPGIDLLYYGNDRRLEYDWIVSPGADPKKIRLTFDGADRVRIDTQGNLVITLGDTEYRHKKPVAYQDVAGKRIEVAGAWVLHGNEAGFRVGTYDRGQPLVIDPVLIYSTYLGGSLSDFANAIAVDRLGNTYLTGGTGSTNFPGSNPLQGSLKGVEDVFVTKINANGTARIYSTYLGGGGPDEGKGIAVSSSGEVYITGNAGSFDFPMAAAIQGTWGGSGDAFVSKLNATGSALVYSTYLGGNAIDYGTAIALDPAGDAYITGVTFSANFPTVSAFQSVKGAQQDAFVAKINPTGSAWVYVTYLGGNNVDEGYAIAADASGNAYVTGYTGSTNFPLQSAFRGANGASVDAFVTKLNPAGSALVYSTYLGGSATDYGTAIAVDSSGSAYVAGVAGSNDFPVGNAMQPNLAGADDAFVTKFNPAGSALVYSTYLGGGSEDQAYALAIDQAGNAWVTGRTNSSDFPLTNPIQATRFAFDMFITEINATGSARLFSTFLGGSGEESGLAIAVDRRGNIHIAGESTSTNFPVVNAIQQTNGGGAEDAIVLLLGDSPWPASFNDFAANGRSGMILYAPSTGQSYTGLSNGNGTFSYIGNLLNPGFDMLLTGDFNGDRKADLIVYNSNTAQAYIGLGNGDGTFTFQSLFLSPAYDRMATGDLNGDGKTDVALYNSSTGTLYTAISNGDGSFTYHYNLVSGQFTFVRLADFTGDGKADLFLYRATDGVAYLGVGDGTGGFTFNPLFVSPGYDLFDIGDLNGDGKADLILYDAASGNTVTGISNGTGGFIFTPMIFTPGFTSVRLADYTGDGNADLTVYNKNNAAAYFGTGTGTGTFTFQALFWSPGYDWVIPEDVNGDGKADVILYNSATGTEYASISQGNGTFTYTYSLWGPGNVLVQDFASTVSANPNPLLSIAKSHNGSFAQGQNATYTVTVSNAANAAPTSGTVTVTENAPTGLTLVSMAGAGWTCLPNTTACTRSDVLNGGSSYAPITVTVNVAGNAPPQLTNEASVSGGGSPTASASDVTNITPESLPTALSFIPITPCRAVDTRNASGPLGGPSIAGGTSRDFAIAGNACGIPASARAFSLNAGILPTSTGYMTLWPTGQPQPGTSSVNSPDAGVHSNGGIVPAGNSGAISAFAAHTMDVVLDINGYFVPTSDNNPNALAFYPLTPCRVVDTRNANGHLGGPLMAANTSRVFPILEAAASCNISTAARAYSLNLAVVPHGQYHYLTGWPDGQTQPFVASVNDPQSVTHSNGAIVPASTGTPGTDGAIDVYVTNDTDVVIDINGYFAPPGSGGLSFYALQPCRALDTRNPAGSPPFTGTIPVNIEASGCGAPPTAEAYVFNATVVPQAGSHGYLTLWEQGAAQPGAANLNDPNGITTGNLAIVPTNNGSINAYFAGTAYLILDLFGYFAP